MGSRVEIQSTAADALDEGSAFRQALAIAIVKSKRRCTQEAAEWRSKAQKLETELEKQQSNQAELRQWLSSVLPQEAPCLQAPVAGSDNKLDSSLQQPGIFLPPLDPAGPGSSEMQQFPLHYASLQQQLARAAAAAGEPYGSVADVLDGKAAALTTMLLTNVKMLQLLQPQSAPHTAQQGPSVPGQVADTVSSVASFIISTLLHAPKSLLSTAYMKQCAAVIAAVLAAPEEHPGAAAAGGCSVQTTQLQEADSPAALAVLVVQLMQQLLEYRAAAAEPAQSSAAHASTGSGGGSSSPAVSAAAITMLQQLSTFPGTALLLCLAVAQRLQCQVQKLLDANAAVLGVRLHNFSTSAGAGEQALLVAGQVFQASHELLLGLESAVVQVPIWGVALASSSWTPKALQDLVSSAAAVYQACKDLQPLLADRICALCANVATALQQLAANGDAPGMRSGLGAELRSVTGGLCVKLRDLFMPCSGC